MSVLIVTSLGDIVVDLHTDRCPLTTKNFLKLCKMKYYNGCLFHKVEKDFMAQTGDRTGTGSGGDSLYKFLYGDQARFFDDEIHPDLKHSKMGTIAMATAGKNCNASQFYFTLRDNVDYLDGKHTVFGVVEEVEGLDTLVKINEAFVDDKGRPLKNIRIKHTYILDDPFADPQQLADFIPEKSPEGKPNDETAEERLEDDWVPLEDTLGGAELEQVLREKEAHTNAAILEGIGDIPDADIKPPDNVLFVCKLNPVTQDEDLHTIFSRFGNVISADIIRDYKTGDSLCYAFIEFETNEACEMAYFKMDNTLIDDRRIHVDFSQSVSKLWSQYRHGKRNQNKGSGCYKCGAPDHIAKDCDKESVGKEKAAKYVLKESNSQHGSSHQRYDLLFGDGDGDDHSTRVTRKKMEAKHSSEGRQTDRERNDNHRHDQGRAEREDDRRHASCRGEVQAKDRVHERNRRVIDIDSELSKRHERIRPGSVDGESKRGPIFDELKKDEKNGTERHQKDIADCQTSGHRRDVKDHKKRNENDKIGLGRDTLSGDGYGEHHRERVLRQQRESSRFTMDDGEPRRRSSDHRKHEVDYDRSGRSDHHSVRHERGDDICGNRKKRPC